MLRVHCQARLRSSLTAETATLEAAQERVKVVQSLTERVTHLRRRIATIDAQRNLQTSEVIELADADVIAATAEERDEEDWWGKCQDCQLISDMLTEKFARENSKGKEAARILIEQRAALEGRRSENALLPNRAENELELRLLRQLRTDRDAEIRDKLAWVERQWCNEKRIRKKLLVEAHAAAQQDQVRLVATAAAVAERACQLAMMDRLRCSIRSLSGDHTALELTIASLAAGAGWNDENEAQRFLDVFVRANTWDEHAVPLKAELVKVDHAPMELILYNHKANELQQNKKMTKSKKDEDLLKSCSHFSPDGKALTESCAIEQRRQEKQTQKDLRRIMTNTQVL